MALSSLNLFRKRGRERGREGRRKREREGEREKENCILLPGDESRPLLKIVFCTVSASPKFLEFNVHLEGQHCLSSWEVRHEINIKHSYYAIAKQNLLYYSKCFLREFKEDSLDAQPSPLLYLIIWAAAIKILSHSEHLALSSKQMVYGNVTRKGQALNLMHQPIWRPNSWLC